MNPESIAQTEKRADGYVGYVVDPAVLYPRMAEHIPLALKNEKPPESGNALLIYWTAAKRIPAEDWRLISLATRDTLKLERGRRAAVLEICRLWFTELLHQAVVKKQGGFLSRFRSPKPMALRITKNPDYAL